jgi:hypothetical protein
MLYEPKIFKNPSDKDKELIVGGKVEVFKAGQSRPVDGFTAHQILNFLNNHGLVEVKLNQEEKSNLADKIETRRSQLEKKSWQELLKMAGSAYKVGMKKNELIELLKEKESRV